MPFEPVSEEKQQQLLTEVLNGIQFNQLSAEAEIKAGAKLFKLALATSETSQGGSEKIVRIEDYSKASPIGEIVYVNSEKTMGYAMIQLDVLYSYEHPNFVAISAATSADNTDASATPADPTTPQSLAYVSTLRPKWFHGLDEKTNIKVDS